MVRLSLYRTGKALKYSLRNTLRSIGLEVLRTTYPTATFDLHLKELIRRRGINCIFDIGACSGQYGQRLRRNGYRGYILSFEPVTESFTELEKLASCDDKWKVYNIALGSKMDQIEINVTSALTMSSFLAPNAYAREVTGYHAAVKRTDRVNVRTIGSIYKDCLRDVGYPNDGILIKMDVQGWENEVITGGETVLRSESAIVALQIEMSARPIYTGELTYMTMIPRLRELGFEVSGMFPIAVDDHMRLVEFDCLMVRADRRE